FRPALIAMPFDEQLLARIVRQDVANYVDVVLQGGGCVRTDRALVVIKQRVFEARKLGVQQFTLFLAHLLRCCFRSTTLCNLRRRFTALQRRRRRGRRGDRRGVRRMAGRDGRSLMACSSGKKHSKAQQGQIFMSHWSSSVPFKTACSDLS